MRYIDSEFCWSMLCMPKKAFSFNFEDFLLAVMHKYMYMYTKSDAPQAYPSDSTEGILYRLVLICKLICTLSALIVARSFRDRGLGEADLWKSRSSQYFATLSFSSNLTNTQALFTLFLIQHSSCTDHALLLWDHFWSSVLYYYFIAFANYFFLLHGGGFEASYFWDFWKYKY